MAFEAAARHRNFTAAAKELALTQGAISRSIQQLEEQLGVALFVRRGPRIALTAAAERLRETVSVTLGRLEADLIAMQMAGDEAATLELAVHPTLAAKWLIPRLPSFYAAHPTIALHLSSQLRPFDFADSRIDVAIYFGAAHWPGAVTSKLMTEREVAVVSPALAKRLGRRPSAADIIELPLLHLESRPDAWERWAAAHELSPALVRRGARFELFSLLVEAACVNLGAAIVPEAFVEDAEREGRLVRLLEPIVHPQQAYFLACRESLAETKPYLAFRDWITGQAQVPRLAGQARSKKQKS